MRRPGIPTYVYGVSYGTTWAQRFMQVAPQTAAAVVLDSIIPRSVRVSEAPSYGQSVITYDPTSPGALSYLEAAREMVTKGVPA